MKTISPKLRALLHVWVFTFVAGPGASAALAADAAKQNEPSRDALQLKLEDAQKRLDSAAREVAELSMSLSEDLMPHAMLGTLGSHRAVLGINISPRHGERDDGVEVMSVSPGGAAADADLKAGDVLLEMNGKPLKRESERSPHERLMSILREVEPNDEVKVRYRRDGKTHEAKLIAQPLRNRMFMTMPPMHGQAMQMPGPLPHFAFMRAEGVFGNAEFVPITPKLGQYFGTDKGLLVVRSPADTRLKLEDGDVLLDIDGRTPSSPSHALRILSSYQEGETLKLGILRAKKRMTFDVTIPKGADGGAHIFHSRHDLGPPPPGPRILLKPRDGEA
jgi:S1-C subfamily serine protease